MCSYAATVWNRASVQTALRAAALVFVVAWLFVAGLRAWIPFWLPVVVLLAAEVEFVLRARRSGPRGKRGRFGPGAEDADLGFGELVEEEDGYRYVPPPPRPPRRHPAVAWLLGSLVAVVVVAFAARSDRARTWQALSSDERAHTERRLTREAATIAGRTVRIRCDEGYAFTGAGSDTLGIAFPRAALAYLDPTICRALRDLLTGAERGERSAEAVVVLAHEAIHLGGERREGVTECLALQAAVPLAVRLGMREGTAHRLLHALYDQRLAERNVIRAAYALPTSCRDGGALDRRPSTAAFP
jgi:hypothetical protein